MAPMAVTGARGRYSCSASALVAGGPEMVMSASPASAAVPMLGQPSHACVRRRAHRGHAHQASGAVRLANATHAGDITLPNTNMQMMRGHANGGFQGLHRDAHQGPASGHRQHGEHQLERAKKYQSLAVAKAAGCLPITPWDSVVHYLNAAYYQSVLKGGPVLNYQDPQSLVYANTANGAVLVAAMYITSYNGPTPQPGGCLTQWHVHTDLCLSGSPTWSKRCWPAGSPPARRGR